VFDGGIEGELGMRVCHGGVSEVHDEKRRIREGRRRGTRGARTMPLALWWQDGGGRKKRVFDAFWRVTVIQTSKQRKQRNFLKDQALN
jgi:hypothetical protein